MESQIRQTAIKAKISHLLNGSYVIKEGWEPNYILYNGRKISRVNIIGVVVSKNQSEFSSNASIIIDDGSGRIGVRSFDDSSITNNTSVGEVVTLVGRPREYGNEIYIVPEIIKGIEDKKWVEVRRLELDLMGAGDANAQRMKTESNNRASDNKITNRGEGEEDAVDFEDFVDGNNEKTTSEKVIELIRSLDNGDGADFDAVVASVKDSGAEEAITNLMKNGDIFELKPGKLKILE